jgi:hypothetical protein
MCRCVKMCCYVRLGAVSDYVFVCATMFYCELKSETMCYYALFVWLSVTMYEDVLLCALWCFYVRSLVLLCVDVLPCSTMYCLRLCACMCDYVLLWANIWDHVLIMCCFMWLSVTMYEDVSLCVMMCCYVWWPICKGVLYCSAMCCLVLLCVDVWRFVAMCDYVLLATMSLYVRLWLTVSWNLRPCVTMRCFVWLSVTMYGDVLLCVLCCYVWPAIFKGVLLCSAMCSHVLLCEDVWRCVAMRDYVLLLTMCLYMRIVLLWDDTVPETMCYYVLLSVTICNYVWRCVAMCVDVLLRVLPCAAMCWCFAMCDYVLLATMCLYVRLCLTMS